MYKDQKHTPKYWVLHDKRSTDVILASASKDRHNVEDFAEKLLSAEWYDNEDFEISLIELNIVKL